MSKNKTRSGKRGGNLNTDKLLEKMDRQSKEALIKALKEKQLVQKENILDRFFDQGTKPKPNPIQKKFFESKARIRALFSGNGSGKTTSLIIELIMAHTRQHPYREVSAVDKTWVICPSYQKIPDYLEEAKKWCPPSKFPKLESLGTPHKRRWVWPNGSTTTFFSAEQDPDQLEGTNLDVLLIDEPIPRSLYVAAYRGLRRNPNHYVVFAGTALDEPWLYTEIYTKGMDPKNKTIEVFQGTTFDNAENLDPEWIKEFSDSLTDDEKKVRLYGEFAVLQGRVFKEFNRRDHVIPFAKWPEDWPVWVRIDCHTRKPSTAIWLGVTKEDELVVIDEAEAPSIEELGALIHKRNKEKKYRVVNMRMDNSGLNPGWDSTKRTAFDALREQGLNVTAVKKYEKDVDESILRIKRLLKPKQPADQKPYALLLFMENCVNTIQQMELYGWKESRHEEKTGKSEKIQKVNDDYIDPLRYAVMARPTFRPALESFSYATGGHSKPKSSGNGLKDKLQKFMNQKLEQSKRRGA